MALANSNPAETKKQASDQGQEQAALDRATARDGTTGGGTPERQSEGDRGYGRQGGSIVDPVGRTDVPVGVEQVESSALSKPDAQTARERQQSPGSRPSAAEGGR